MGQLDYHLLPDAIVVEELAIDDEVVAVELYSAAWTAGTGWHDGVGCSRALRADPSVRAGGAPVDRAGAQAAYRARGGSELPDEATLRGYFGAGLAMGGPPLVIGHTRVYRILFAGDLDARLVGHWGLVPGQGAGIAGTGVWEGLHVDVRRVGGAAWAADVTTPGATRMLVRVLQELASGARAYGLIPVTVERLS
jgi:hypothetical protein